MVDGNYKCSIIRTYEDTGATYRHNGIMKLYWQDEQLKGSMFPTFYWLNSPFRGGTVDGNNFAFTVYFSTPCQQFMMEVSGTVDGDTVTGKAIVPTGECVLIGTRIKE